MNSIRQSIRWTLWYTCEWKLMNIIPNRTKICIRTPVYKKPVLNFSTQHWISLTTETSKLRYSRYLISVEWNNHFPKVKGSFYPCWSVYPLSKWKRVVSHCLFYVLHAFLLYKEPFLGGVPILRKSEIDLFS